MSGCNDAKKACAPILQAVYQLLSQDTDHTFAAPAVESIDSIDSLRLGLETLFKSQSAPVQEPQFSKPLDYPRQEIDTAVGDEVLLRLLGRTEQTFAALARTEPHWAVITNDLFRADRIDQSIEQFYETGRDNLSQIDAFLGRHLVDREALPHCFELGSGVGRVTFWLAQQFKHVVASDISGRMLELAEERLSSKGIDNVSYVQITDFTVFDRLNSFDMFFSSIVFQHNPPPVQRYMLSRILSKLKPGGIALFQIIGAIRDYRFNALDYLNEPTDEPKIEMHPLPHKELFAIAEEQLCKVLEIREDNSCGPVPDMISNMVMLQKIS